MTVAASLCGQGVAHGVEPGANFIDAMRWYARAAEAGDPEAQFMYGLRLEKGLEVSSDPSAAREWFRRAAQQGHAGAQFKLAILLEQEGGGEEEIIDLYESAARQGLAAAQYNLAAVLLNAADSAQERIEALAWATLADGAGLEAASSLRSELIKLLPREEIRQAIERTNSLRQELDLSGRNRSLQ